MEAIYLQEYGDRGCLVGVALLSAVILRELRLETYDRSPAKRGARGGREAGVAPVARLVAAPCPFDRGVPGSGCAPGPAEGLPSLYRGPLHLSGSSLQRLGGRGRRPDGFPGGTEGEGLLGAGTVERRRGGTSQAACCRAWSLRRSTSRATERRPRGREARDCTEARALQELTTGGAPLAVRGATRPAVQSAAGRGVCCGREVAAPARCSPGAAVRAARIVMPARAASGALARRRWTSTVHPVCRLFGVAERVTEASDRRGLPRWPTGRRGAGRQRRAA